MLTPVPSTLPDSTLQPSGVLQKFNVQMLSGLGRGPFPFGFAGLGQCGGCAEYDDSGNCITLEPDCPNPPVTSTLPLPTTAYSDAAAAAMPPNIDCAAGYYLAVSGSCLPNPVTVAPGVSTSPSTTVSSLLPVASSSALTSAQIAGLLSQGIAGATQAAALAQLPAGYSIGPQGQIIAPGSVAASTSLLSGSSGTILLMLALGVGVFIMMEGKK
jgi:hypothetical protein